MISIKTMNNQSIVYICSSDLNENTMPKGVKIDDDQLLDRFKKAVQQKLDFSVTLNKNYARFSELVYERTGLYVSASTIKRVFSENSKTTPTKYSLDCIAKTIGYNGWDDFIKKDQQFGDFELHEIIYNLKYESYKDFKEFKTLFNRYVDTPNCYNITLALIEAAISINDEETLKTIFDLPKVWDLIPDNHTSFYFIEKVGMLFRDSSIIHKLIPFYSTHPVAQKSFVEIVVDEERLNGYYGEFLEAYSVHKTTVEAQLFYHCMMCQRDFENGDFNSHHFNYLLHFEPNDKIHPIPLVRRVALLIVKYIDNTELIDTLIDELSTLIEDLDENDFNFCIYKFCNLVFQTRESYPIKKALALMKVQTDYFSYNYFINRLLNLIKIYEAFVLAKSGDIKSAHEKLMSYNRLFGYPNNFKKTKIHFDIVNRLIETEVKSKSLILK